MSISVCPDEIVGTTEPFIAKLGMVMYHHEPECHAERLLYCFQGQGHSEDSYKENMTFCYMFNPLWLTGLAVPAD